MSPLEILTLFRGLVSLGSAMAETVSHITGMLEAAQGRDLSPEEVSEILTRAGVSEARRKEAIAGMEG